MSDRALKCCQPAIFCALAVCLAAAGCARLGQGAVRVALPGDAPSLEEIVADLDKNNSEIRTFRAAGSFTLESPEFEAVRKFRSGRVLFRRPAQLYAQGNHRITNTILFKLISDGKEFLIEFPTNRDESYYQTEGAEFEDVPFSVSPSDIVREMFLPEEWGRLRARHIRLVAYDVETQRATLLVGPRQHPRRRVEVGRIDPTSPTWVVLRNELFDDDGALLAVTMSGDHHALDGIYFPARVDAYFPTESTRMTFEMRNIRLNVEIDDEFFDIRSRILELNLDEAKAR